MARVPLFKLSYLGTDITRDVRPLVSSIVLTDKLEGESDELEISLDNSDLRWIDTWSPNEGDTVSLQLGYQGEALMPEVMFEVDEPEYSGPPDILRLKGLATPITASLRQRRTQAYENTTLRAIAQVIADRHGLELIGEVPEIAIERATQKEVADLRFLRDTAAEYGLIFKIESSTRLVFYRESALEAAAAILTIERSQISRYVLRRGAAGTYKAAKISYLDPKTGEYTEVAIAANGDEVRSDEETPEGEESGVATGDTLTIRERFENREQAVLKATEALRRANRGQIEGRIELEGDVRLSGGVNISLSGFRRFDGKYQVSTVRHKFTKEQGFRSSAKLKGLEVTGEQQQGAE